MTEYERQEALSKIALADPQPGDHWHEMYSWRMFVVKRDGDLVTTMEASAPCEFPRDGRIFTRTLMDFKIWLSYKNIPGTWCKCLSRGEDVSDWLK